MKPTVVCHGNFLNSDSYKLELLSCVLREIYLYDWRLPSGTKLKTLYYIKLSVKLTLIVIYCSWAKSCLGKTLPINCGGHCSCCHPMGPQKGVNFLTITGDGTGFTVIKFSADGIFERTMNKTGGLRCLRYVLNSLDLL